MNNWNKIDVQNSISRIQRSTGAVFFIGQSFILKLLFEFRNYYNMSNFFNKSLANLALSYSVIRYRSSPWSAKLSIHLFHKFTLVLLCYALFLHWPSCLVGGGTDLTKPLTKLLYGSQSTVQAFILISLYIQCKSFKEVWKNAVK